MVVGLGNPGPEYADTRHNAGFRLADAAWARWGFPPFRRAGPARATEGTVDGLPVRIVKPLTYMNRSGVAVAPLLDTAGFDHRRDLLVLVDDAVLPLGRFRLRASGSSGGHNGLESVEDALGSQLYARLRIGIGPAPEGVDLSAFVLGSFRPDEARALDELLPVLVDAVECWVREGVDIAMTRYNQRGTT